MERRFGDLATIADQQTLDFIKNKLVLGDSHWIGAEKSSGEWRWADGTPWSFSAWGTVNPNNHGATSRATIYTNYKWYAQINGNHTVNYICQY